MRNTGTGNLITMKVARISLCRLCQQLLIPRFCDINIYENDFWRFSPFPFWLINKTLFIFARTQNTMILPTWNTYEEVHTYFRSKVLFLLNMVLRISWILIFSWRRIFVNFAMSYSSPHQRHGITQNVAPDILSGCETGSRDTSESPLSVAVGKPKVVDRMKLALLANADM